MRIDWLGTIINIITFFTDVYYLAQIDLKIMAGVVIIFLSTGGDIVRTKPY